MSGWRSARFAVVDLELTGTDPRTDAVLAVGIVPVRDGVIKQAEAYYSLVRPVTMPDADTIVIHGIRPADLQAAPQPQEVAREVEEHLRGHVLVAHVAEIERRFLNEWLPKEHREAKRVIDTDQLVRLLLAREEGRLLAGHVGLGAAAGRFGLPEHRRHHALGDALTTAQLFIACAANLSRSRGHEVSVTELSRAGRALRAEERKRGTGWRWPWAQRDGGAGCR